MKIGYDLLTRGGLIVFLCLATMALFNLSERYRPIGDNLLANPGFAERLREELGVEPEAETVRLIHALREEASQGAPPETRSQFVRPAARQRLPRPPTSFVGRGRELDLLKEIFRRPDVRLVTLLAQGGVLVHGRTYT